jgi:DNA invertase Pin-like site-specific DNA recombinase
VVAEFKDEHRSAFRKIEREEFEALLRAASDGKIDVIIARHQDRLLRHPETYSRLLEICVRRKFRSISTAAAGFSICRRRRAVSWE